MSIAERTRPSTIHHREEVMGTVVTIDLYRDAGIDPDEALGPLARAVARLHDADRIFSTWKSNSALMRLRRGEISFGEAPPEVAEVLELCHRVRDLSGHWFDPWAMPEGLDPTGLVKGWAAQRALDELIELGLDGAMVNAAGDIASFGGPIAQSAFRVGVVRPDAPTELCAVVVPAGAIATSGDYERGAHLVNPFDHAAQSAVASATVTGPDLAVADALATALCVGGDVVLDLVAGIDDYEAFIIDRSGELRATSAFPFAR
jgi:FAD:protein FMN transferase